MSDGDLLQIEPHELQFPFELKKQISCSMQLTNNSDLHVAFKVKTTNPRKYCVRPNTGVVEPHSACEVIVTMQAQKEAPPDMQCRDKFLLQCVLAGARIAAKDIAPEMFDKESGNQVEECKLKVSYIPPPLRPSSPVREGSEDESSPRVSVSEDGDVNQISESNYKSKTNVEPQESTSEDGKALISKLAEEKRNAVQQHNKLLQELELLRRQRSRSHGGVPFVYVIIVGLIGFLLGYLLKRM
ncbi:vesicle-associated protein 1-2-like isoform X1 [Primulina eburnea]|uniref:vesicle-associated protein 1-2-like isoform X1 n=2 Tax=Primulina eburnea TaxID=1245227 RepID=UPI003C6C3EEF